jgi:predicted ArsR family transcriptional regulator
MPGSRWDQRFFASTRGRIVWLLRRASRTVDELAAALDLTDNAVRAHLATLERDGLVEQKGLRRGVGKPAYSYILTPEADALFPKAYGPVLKQLLGVLAERLPPEALDDVMRTVGRRIAASQPELIGDVRTRLDAAVAVLDDLGGLAEVEEQDGRLVLRGYSCPLAAAVPDHPETCALAEALLTQIVGVPVREQCERGDSPRCCFEVVGDARGPRTP